MYNIFRTRFVLRIIRKKKEIDGNVEEEIGDFFLFVL